MLVAASRELLAVYEDHLLVVDVQGARHRVHVTEPLELLSASGRTVLGARDDVLVEYVVSPRGVLERARLVDGLVLGLEGDAVQTETGCFRLGGERLGALPAAGPCVYLDAEYWVEDGEVLRWRDLAPARNAARRLLSPLLCFWQVESVVAHIP